MTAPTLPETGWMSDPRRGAALGRADRGDATQAPVKFFLCRVRLDRGGYDDAGAYWGVGKPLYWACSEHGAHDRFFRAADRDAAKARLRVEFPNARFFR